VSGQGARAGSDSPHERAQVVEEIVSFLRDGVNVTLMGLRGSGRSHVAGLVADRLRDAGLAVVAVRGIAALRERPIAALALAGIDVSSNSLVVAISDAVAALLQALPPARSALVVDDADDLDPATAGVIAAAFSRRRFPVLTVIGPKGRHQAGGQRMATEFQPGMRVELEPMDFASMHRFIHRMLPGPVDSATVARIATLSGGVPLLAKAIIIAGQQSGAIAKDPTIWRVAGELWDGRLAHAIEPLLGDLAADELDALTRLALAGTVTAAKAREIAAEGLLARLDDLGLLQVAQTLAEPLIGVFPPLVADYLRQSGSVMPRLQPRVGAGRDPWATPSPMSRVPLTTARAAILDARIAEYWQAEVEALRESWRAEPNAENAMALLPALSAGSAGAHEFAAVFGHTRLEGVDPGALTRFVGWHASYRTLAQDDAEGAFALLDELDERLGGKRDEVRARKAMLRLLVGPLPQESSLAVPAEDDDRGGAESLEAVRIMVLLAAGRTADAAEALEGFEPTCPGNVEAARIAIGLARVLHGDLDAGVEWALRGLAEAEARLDLGEIHAHAYVAALGLEFAGRLDELEALLGPVLALRGTAMQREHYHVGLLSLAGVAAGWRGDLAHSRSLSVQAETSAVRSGPFPGMLHGVVTLAEGPEDAFDKVGERVWQAAEERSASGYAVAGVAAAVAAVFFAPEPERALIAARRARQTQSPFLAALGDFIEASVSGDPDMLAECTADLTDRGARTLAIRAAVTRTLVLRGRGELEAAMRQAEWAWARAAELGREHRGFFFAPLVDAIGLTARERELALMLRDGASTQSIAASLSLSARTVESHMLSAYRKLGCDNRDDFVRAVSTWASLG
jgi:DNA-binding CsgD family transcriptional regulator